MPGVIIAQCHEPLEDGILQKLAAFCTVEPECVIGLIPDQRGNLPQSGTLRLGAYPCALKEDTPLRRIYGASLIPERHCTATR